MNEDSVIVIDRQEERKKRGALAVILAIAFIALLGIGSTFAYLTWTANQTPNRSTMGELTADLIEPTYTNAAITDNGGQINASGNGAYTAPTTAATKYWSADGRLIPKGAANMIPSSEYTKNPIVINTSESEDAVGFAGIKVQFQYWQHGSTSESTGDAGAKWANMNQTQVAKLLKVYSISSDANNTEAGLHISKSSKKWKYTGVNTETETTVSGDAGFTQNKWVQMLGYNQIEAAAGGSYVNGDVSYGTYTPTGATEAQPITEGMANADGAMYFLNYSRLTSAANAKSYDNTAVSNEVSTTAATKGASMASATWGYKADDVNDGSTKSATATVSSETVQYPEADSTNYSALTSYVSSTSPLFQYVRYVDTASQADIDAFMNEIDPIVTYKSGTTANDFTPGWRMVISGAIIQSTSPADVLGSASGYESVTNPIITVDSSTKKVTANPKSTWFANFKEVLDNVGTGAVDSNDSANNVNRKNASKPIAATGVRQNSKLGNWYIASNMGKETAAITEITGDGVPESSNIGLMTDKTGTDGYQVGSKDFNGNTSHTTDNPDHDKYNLTSGS